MEIGHITHQDLEAFRHIRTHSFYRGVPPEVKSEDLKPDEWLGAFEKGRLEATLRILDFQMFFGADRRPCGGIAGVACEPAARGRGYAGNLLERSLEVMRERGQYLASLWPFSFSYYRRYGWEWVGPALSHKVPLDLIPAQEEARWVEPLFDDLPRILNPVYEEVACRYNGMLARDAARWDALLNRNQKRETTTYVYRRGGQVEGYARVRYGDKAEEVVAREFIAATSRAYCGLLGLFRRYAMTVKTIEWRAPLDELLGSILMHWDVESRLEPQGMSRIVDLPAAFKALKPDPRIRCSAPIAVHDEKAAWNAGVWIITADSGEVDAKPGTADPAVTLDIQALSQAYWGAPSLDWLRRAGRVGVTDERAFAALALLLPPKPVWLLDDF